MIFVRRSAQSLIGNLARPANMYIFYVYVLIITILELSNIDSSIGPHVQDHLPQSHNPTKLHQPISHLASNDTPQHGLTYNYPIVILPLTLAVKARQHPNPAQSESSNCYPSAPSSPPPALKSLILHLSFGKCFVGAGKVSLVRDAVCSVGVGEAGRFGSAEGGWCVVEEAAVRSVSL
jgi:hypothetical protein